MAQDATQDFATREAQAEQQRMREAEAELTRLGLPEAARSAAIRAAEREYGRSTWDENIEGFLEGRGWGNASLNQANQVQDAVNGIRAALLNNGFDPNQLSQSAISHLSTIGYGLAQSERNRSRD